MAEHSAGLLVFRWTNGVGVEFLLAHPGGPFWARRDLGAWSIPKGLIGADEEPLAAARREFVEETGLVVDGPFQALSPVRQKSGKRVHAWLVEGDLDLSAARSNLFEMEWPRASGHTATYPEIDRLAYFPPAEAFRRLLPAQRPLLAQGLERCPISRQAMVR